MTKVLEFFEDILKERLFNTEKEAEEWLNTLCEEYQAEGYKIITDDTFDTNSDGCMIYSTEDGWIAVFRAEITEYRETNGSTKNN